MNVGMQECRNAGAQGCICTRVKSEVWPAAAALAQLLAEGGAGGRRDVVINLIVCIYIYMYDV